MAKNYHSPNMGSSPLDGIANASAAVQSLWKKIKGKKPMSPREFAAMKKNQALDAFADKVGYTRGMCTHRGTKRGTKCSCGTRIL